jgi:putative addiction module component (TIGR02574 family)
MDPTTALQAVAEWPVEDQLELVFRLWDHIIDNGWKPEPSEELKAELDRRLAAYRADPSRALTWDEVMAHVRRAR